MTQSEQFCFNLEHHGGEANTALTFALIEKMERVGFERRMRRTTLTFSRNGRVVVMQRAYVGGQMVVRFHLHGDPQPIVSVRPAEIREIAQRGNRRQRLRATDNALSEIVEALYLATDAAA
jgi:hypothetical protein